MAATPAVADKEFARQQIRKMMIEKLQEKCASLERVVVWSENPFESNDAQVILMKAQKENRAEMYHNFCVLNPDVDEQNLKLLLDEQLKVMVENFEVLTNIYDTPCQVVVEIVPSSSDYLKKHSVPQKDADEFAFLCTKAWVLKKTPGQKARVPDVTIDYSGIGAHPQVINAS